MLCEFQSLLREKKKKGKATSGAGKGAGPAYEALKGSGILAGSGNEQQCKDQAGPPPPPPPPGPDGNWGLGERPNWGWAEERHSVNAGGRRLICIISDWLSLLVPH
jgi:hypothetical protein